jgi:meso-butanediol dehydrogenase / (S,S)-butanediol dehydrogenase / diacetyl reductase
MNGKVAIVTGAGRGIGRAIAMRLAGRGASVAIADLNETAAAAVAKEIQDRGGCAAPVQVDVSRPDQVKAMVEKVVALFGRLDIMVANAGISHPVLIPEVTEEFWDKMIDVNLKGVFFCDQQAAIQMIKQGEGGRIINASSESGRHGFALMSVYCASKFGVVGLTQSFANELAKYKITVNAYCPGVVDTPLWAVLDEEFATMPGGTTLAKEVRNTPLGRVQTPEDVADLVEFLASPQGGFITGDAILTTGGRVMI